MVLEFSNESSDLGAPSDVLLVLLPAGKPFTCKGLVSDLIVDCGFEKVTILKQSIYFCLGLLQSRNRFIVVWHVLFFVLLIPTLRSQVLGDWKVASEFAKRLDRRRKDMLDNLDSFTQPIKKNVPFLG